MGCTSGKSILVEVKVLYDGQVHYARLHPKATVQALIDVVNGGQRQRWLEVSFRGKDIEDKDSTLVMNDIRDTNDVYVKFDKEKFQEHIESVKKRAILINGMSNRTTIGEILVKYALVDELFILIDDKDIELDSHLVNLIKDSNDEGLLSLLKHFKK